MSVNIEEMAAHLGKPRQNEVVEQYEQSHTHATTAFLLCFFLGYIGAHRFYLGQWRSGLAHLAIFALGAAALVAGFLTTAPLNAAFFVIGGVLVLASLIWEIIDLGRIDSEIHQRNLLLAEGLIAGALLSDSTAIEQAESKLDEAVHTAASQSRAASAAPAAATAGMISLEDLAKARALAEESGRASISYQELSNFTVSETPEERAGMRPVFEPATVTERKVNTEPLPASPEEPPAVETQTHIHSEDAYRVTDSVETDHVSGPSAAEAIGLGAAALGAAGAGFGMAEEMSAHEIPASEPVSEAVTEPEPAVTQSVEMASTEATSTLQADEITAPVEATTSNYTPTEPVTPSAPAAPDFFTTETVAPTTPETSRIGGDVTDAGTPTYIEPAADVAFSSSYPGYITLPEEPAPAPVEPIFANEVYSEPPTGTSAADAVTEPDIPLYITPDEPAPTYTPSAAPEPPAESYVPPVPDVYSAAAPQPELYRPSWETPTTPVTSTPEQVEPTRESNTLAEMAGLGAVAGAGALATDALSHHPTELEPAPSEPVALEPTPAEPATPEPAAVEPAAPKMKRIRIKHRIVVEGQVVREEIVEREVPADMDMAVAAQQIQAELERTSAASPDEIARLANLSADEELEVHRHVEGLGQ